MDIGIRLRARDPDVAPISNLEGSSNMALKIDNALSSFNLADMVDLNCGNFDIRIRQAAVHNEQFRAAVSKRSLNAKRKSLVPAEGTMTGSYEEDVRLFCDVVILGWGERPLRDDDGIVVAPTKENLFELFTSSQNGKVLFGKVMTAATSDEMFIIREEDLGNSAGS